MSFLRHESCSACGSSDANAIYEDGGQHCFSCGAHIHANPLKRAVAAFPRKAKGVERGETKTLPGEAMDWLGQYKLTEQELALFSWNPQNKHLIYREGDFYNARNFGDGPKYISYGSKPYSVRNRGNPLVLVEDVISGILVSRATASLTLFGTAIGTGILLDRWRQSGNTPIAIWIDPDKRREAIELSQKINSLGVCARVIFSDMDPKYYNQQEIERYLQ